MSDVAFVVLTDHVRWVVVGQEVRTRRLRRADGQGHGGQRARRHGRVDRRRRSATTD